MPWAMFFNDAGGRSGLAIHEGDVSKPFDSHGCLRIPYGKGEKLYRATEIGTPVEIITEKGGDEK